MKRFHYIAISVLSLFASCQNDLFENVEIDNDSVTTMRLSGSNFEGPRWLVEKMDSITVSHNGDFGSGQKPWVYSVSENGQEYLCLFDAFSSSDDQQFTVYQKNGKRVEPGSAIFQVLMKKEKELVWREKKEKLQTRVSSPTFAYIYTPYGSLLPDAYYTPETLSAAAKQALRSLYESSYPNAVYLSEATSTYNCHGYAWHMRSVNQTPVWIGKDCTISEDRYWEDHSYIETTESDATVVSYVEYIGHVNDLDHSAIPTGTSGIVISKWAENPLFRHPIAHCPYVEPSNDFVVKYYKRNPRPAYYIGRDIYDYSSGNTYISFSGGSAYITLYAYMAKARTITRYEWSAEYYGSCDRWFISPSGNQANISIYPLHDYDSGSMRITCKMYDGNYLEGTAYYYLNVMSASGYSTSDLVE